MRATMTMFPYDEFGVGKHYIFLLIDSNEKEIGRCVVTPFGKSLFGKFTELLTKNMWTVANTSVSFEIGD